MLLAERSLAGNNVLEGQRQLELLRRHKADPTLAGRAVLLLAQSAMKRGQTLNAVDYYTILKRDFGSHHGPRWQDRQGLV